MTAAMTERVAASKVLDEPWWGLERGLNEQKKARMTLSDVFWVIEVSI